ncbi:MAG: hypothetical protein IKU28_06215 [Erysipelotrichaceae bacterium]|nr:hypothetical protein [Erysipelotrichaceae bacterium]
MKAAIGIDGGGTKTAFVIGNETEIFYQIEKSGCSYLEIGKEAVVDLIVSGVKELLEKCPDAKCDACCIGMPCYGENRQMDEWLNDTLKQALSPIEVQLVNDAVVGWAGSLECREGIHVVAGTGSLAIGKGKEDTFARAGGWNEFFGDEGSCYWIGKEAMTLFSKQADGRIQKGALYNLVKEKYQLQDDFEFIDVVLNELAPYRDQVAGFQKIALQAANEHDESVIALYERAVDELVQMVYSVKQQLNWSTSEVTVSIYGGLMHAKEFVLELLRQKLKSMDCILEMPKRSAVEGALLMAMNMKKTSE